MISVQHQPLKGLSTPVPDLDNSSFLSSLLYIVCSLFSFFLYLFLFFSSTDGVIQLAIGLSRRSGYHPERVRSELRETFGFYFILFCLRSNIVMGKIAITLETNHCLLFHRSLSDQGRFAKFLGTCGRNSLKGGGARI